MRRRSRIALPLALVLCGCGYDGPDAAWCDNSDPPPIVSFPYVVVVDSTGAPLCPPGDAVIRAVQRENGRDYTLVLEPGSRGVRQPDGSVLTYDDPRGCNVFESPAADALAYCRPHTLTAIVTSPSCGTFERTIGWLENYGTGSHGIDWIVPIEISCPAP